MIQNLESLSFDLHGDEFISAHIDGSYTVWSLSDAARPKLEPVTPYGQFTNVSLCHSLCSSAFLCTYLLSVKAKSRSVISSASLVHFIL